MKKLIILSLGLIIMVNGCFEKKEYTSSLKIKGAKEDQELLEAITLGNVENVIEALRRGANPNAEMDDRKMYT